MLLLVKAASGARRAQSASWRGAFVALSFSLLSSEKGREKKLVELLTSFFFSGGEQVDHRQHNSSQGTPSNNQLL